MCRVRGGLCQFRDWTGRFRAIPPRLTTLGGHQSGYTRHVTSRQNIRQVLETCIMLEATTPASRSNKRVICWTLEGHETTTSPSLGAASGQIYRAQQELVFFGPAKCSWAHHSRCNPSSRETWDEHMEGMQCQRWMISSLQGTWSTVIYPTDGRKRINHCFCVFFSRNRKEQTMVTVGGHWWLGKAVKTIVKTNGSNFFL